MNVNFEQEIDSEKKRVITECSEYWINNINRIYAQNKKGILGDKETQILANKLTKNQFLFEMFKSDMVSVFGENYLIKICGSHLFVKDKNDKRILIAY